MKTKFFKKLSQWVVNVSDIAALVVAAGFVVAEVPIMYNIYTSKKDCNFYFNRVKCFKTTII